MKGHDPIEAIEETMGKRDALNPFKAIEKVKGMLAVFCFTLGLLPLLVMNFFRLVPVILVVGGLWLVCQGIRILWTRSRHL